MPELGKLAGPDGGMESQKLAKFWVTQIKEIFDAPAFKVWHERGMRVEERYRDERNRSQEMRTKRYNALWGNIQILQPALYGRCPVPICERRFKDKDTVGRSAATILERGLRNEIEINSFNESVSRAVLDYLLPGRGVVWVRYEPIIGKGPSLELTPETDMKDDKGDIKTGKGNVDDKPGLLEKQDEEETPQDQEGEPEAPGVVEDTDQEIQEDEKLEEAGSRILRESVQVDYLPWRDFFTLPVRARTWSEVTAVGKRIYMSRDQAKRRFGTRIGAKLPFQRDDRAALTRNEMTTDQPGLENDKCEVFEIWSKQDTHVYWVAEGYEYLCDELDDPLRLDGFFPTPRPLLANWTSTILAPVPDYIQYQDQALQIDELTQRISMLAKACKVAGVYNAAAQEIKRLFEEAVENQLIPVAEWAAFAKDGGGVEGNLSFIPLKEIMGVLNELMQIKQTQIEEMDRLTGINDILRGTTDARETLGAQRLKTNNTGTRLSARQDEIARFCRDVVRLMADVMCKHFSPQSLIEVSGALYSEGLAPSDMPPLTQLLDMVTSGLGMPGGVPGVSSPMQMPNPGMPQGGPPGGPPGQAGPPGPPGPQGAPPPNPGMMSPPAMPQQGMQPPQPPQLPPEVKAKLDSIQKIIQAISLLRDERLVGFRVDIEVDSTIYGDNEQEKEDRTEFLRAVTDYLQQAMLMSQQMPEMAPLLGKFLQFGVRGFKIGRDLESAIEETVEELPQLMQKKMEMMMQHPPPDLIRAQAQMIKANASVGDKDAKHQFEMLRAQADIASANQKQQSDQQKAQAEMARQVMENEGQQHAQQMKLAEHGAKAQTAQVQGTIDQQIKYLELQIKLMEMQRQQGEHRANLAMEPHKTAQTHAQIGIESQIARQNEAQAMQTRHQAPVEVEHTKQAAINAQAAQFRAQHPQPMQPQRPNPRKGPGNA